MAPMLYQPVAGQPVTHASTTASKMEVKLRRDGQALILTCQGQAPPRSVWLGCSMYRKGVKNAAAEGLHNAVLVSSTFTYSWRVPSSFEGGTFEAALWGDRVLRNQCRIVKDPWCARNGFHLTGLITYKSGWLVAR